MQSALHSTLNWAHKPDQAAATPYSTLPVCRRLCQRLPAAVVRSAAVRNADQLHRCCCRCFIQQTACLAPTIFPFNNNQLTHPRLAPLLQPRWRHRQLHQGGHVVGGRPGQQDLHRRTVRRRCCQRGLQVRRPHPNHHGALQCAPSCLLACRGRGLLACIHSGLCAADA